MPVSSWNGEAAAMTHAALALEAVRVTRAALAPLVKDLELAAMRPLPCDSEPLKLLSIYVKALKNDVTLKSPALRSLAATHVQDLVALIVGATRDGAEIAGRRGVRAARLAAIKSCDGAHRAGDVTLSDVAARRGLSPRHIPEAVRAPTAPPSRRSCSNTSLRGHNAC